MSAATSKFVDIVQESFGHLAAVHEMWLSSASEGLICFESSTAFLHVIHDYRRLGELSVVIGPVSASDDRRIGFGLDEILRLQALPSARYVAGLRTHDPVALADAVASLSELTEQHAAKYLGGDAEQFAIVAGFRKKESAEYALAREQRRTARGRNR